MNKILHKIKMWNETSQVVELLTGGKYTNPTMSIWDDEHFIKVQIDTDIGTIILNNSK